MNTISIPVALILITTSGVARPLAASTISGDWVARHFGNNTAVLPLSFKYGGRSSSEVLPAWKLKQELPKPRGVQRSHTVRLTDPVTGLLIECEVTQYTNHPAVEWVLHFENTGTNDTPILENISTLDLPLDSPAGNALVHYARGATCSMDDFQPLTEPMGPGARLHLEAGGGRSSSDFLPFFNWEIPSREGVIIGLGWSGEWAADFTQSAPKQTRIKAGLALTHLKLHPGERIRSPRVALLYYKGDWIDGQNQWRRFLLEHHRPTVNGHSLVPPLLNGTWGRMHASNHLANIKAIAAANLPVDYYWIDAEWFGRVPWWQNTGNWQVNKDFYPQGLKPLSDLLHQSGRRFLLWFEPERVCEGTPWAAELDKWLLALPPERKVYRWEKQTFPDWVKSESLRNQIKENDRLVDLGNPQARKFITDFFSDCVREYGLDCYRHDANIAPLEFWRAADAPDRQGMTEIRWVEGLYAFWDELLRRHPHLIIDNCASGGRRIDLETIERSTPFWRTDFPGDPNGKQCHTYGLSFWVPLNATGSVTPGRDSEYAWRSTISSSVVFGLFNNDEASQTVPPFGGFPIEKARAALEQYRRLQPCFLGDYYPLSGYSKALDIWMAWQFHRADLGEGLVQAFRRDHSVYESARFKLRGLQPDARYRIVNLDSPDTKEMSGAELLEKGLPVSIAARPGSAILTYHIAK
ncbi:MAG TPA: alpha-galactosidase [Candidatus Paceibacterota bacterium]|nr:alpha-galactosidase [Verrucomicrobiota bacterium]HSA11703.1 alpha-galactosidase [Candidatus Paceibacterota bacterium]